MNACEKVIANSCGYYPGIYLNYWILCGYYRQLPSVINDPDKFESAFPTGMYYFLL